MTNPNSDYFRLRSTWVSIGIMVLGTLFSLVFLSNSLQTLAITAAIAPFSVLLVWNRFPLPPAGRAGEGRPMTIRVRLKRTRALFQRFVVCMDLLWCVAVTLYLRESTTLQQYALAIVGSVVLAYTASLFVRAQMSCPRCGINFKQARIAQVGRWSTYTRGAEEYWERCPNCGVGFDEPYQR